MTNTIPNVPRELLDSLLTVIESNGYAADEVEVVDELRALLSAPSPAGVDGLDVVGWYRMDDRKAITPYPSVCATWHKIGVKVGAAYSDSAHAIIDGLRGEVAEQEETANHWRDLALQFDRHRMAAMAHIRAAASGDKSAIEALGVFAALPPIPGHEITTEHDQQAQRICELEGLLREVAASLAWNAHGECRAIHDGPIMPSQMAIDAVKAALGGSL